MENKIRQYGYKEPVLKPEDYILGGGKIPDEILQENGNWLNYLPLFEKQQKNTESYNCVSFATLNILEILLQKKYNV